MAGIENLKKDIRRALSTSTNDNCLSERELRRQVDGSPDKFKKALKELCEDAKVEKAGPQRYCSLENDEGGFPSAKVITLPITRDIRVGKVVAKATEPLTTRELAEAAKMPPRQVYSVCRRLEKKGYFQRGDPAVKHLLFSPLTGEVVHGGNYGRIKTLDQKLRGIAAQFSPGDPKTERSLQRFFGGVLKKKEHAKHRKSIYSFRKRMLKAVSQAQGKKDVSGLLGLRPFDREIPTWRSSL